MKAPGEKVFPKYVGRYRQSCSTARTKLIVDESRLVAFSDGWRCDAKRTRGSKETILSGEDVVVELTGREVHLCRPRTSGSCSHFFSNLLWLLSLSFSDSVSTYVEDATPFSYVHIWYRDAHKQLKEMRKMGDQASIRATQPDEIKKRICVSESLACGSYSKGDDARDLYGSECHT